MFVLILQIPGQESIHLIHAVFDMNGTLAKEGKLIDGVSVLFKQVSQQYKCHILTNDTFGTAASVESALGIPITVVGSGEEKANVVKQLGNNTVAVGNGSNDYPMLLQSSLKIVVLGPEGTSGRVMSIADIITPSILVALELLLSPQKIIATMRP